MESIMENMLLYKLRILLSILVGMFMKRMTAFRFGKEWRHGVKFYHRLVYQHLLCTFLCNLVADSNDTSAYWYHCFTQARKGE